MVDKHHFRSSTIFWSSIIVSSWIFAINFSFNGLPTLARNNNITVPLQAQVQQRTIVSQEVEQTSYWNKDNVKQNRVAIVHFSWKTKEPYTLLLVEEKEESAFAGLCYKWDEDTDSYSLTKNRFVIQYPMIIVANVKLTPQKKLTIDDRKTIESYFADE